MEKKVYYGEYTLRHWIGMLLTKNIVLPPYQRSFVWEEKGVKALLKTFEEDGFVPPISIGVCNIDGNNVNLILDGQQRLSSLLLAYFKVFPKKDAFKRPVERMSLADGTAEDEPDEVDDELIDWTFRELTNLGSSIEKIKNNINFEQYEAINYGFEDELFDTRRLGFTFVVPLNTEATEQQRFFSSLFRNINLKGVRLDPMESRKSLYFLNASYSNFFEPDFVKNIKINLTAKKQNFDFTRAMALLSQYRKDGRSNKVAQGYKPRMEEYYEQYIYDVVNDEANSIFVQFSSIFPNKEFIPKLEILKEMMSLLNYTNIRFTSIIDSDVYMLGLIYHCVICGKVVDSTKIVELKAKLESQIKNFKKDISHKSSPSLFKFMRLRVDKSISIFNRYVTNPVV